MTTRTEFEPESLSTNKRSFLAFLRFLAPGLLSNLLLFLAFPPVHASLLVFVALAPWFASLRFLNRKSAWASGWWFGLVLVFIQLDWLLPFVARWTQNIWLALIPWVMAAVLGGLLYSFLTVAIHWLLKRSLWWFVPFAWVGFECVRAYLPGIAFPWGILAFPLWKYPEFVQTAAYGTIFLVSAWVCFINLFLSLLFWPDKGPVPMRIIARSVLVIGAFVGFSFVRLLQPYSGAKHTIVIGQPGVDMSNPASEEVLDSLEASAKPIVERALLYGADLLVLPEGYAPGSDRLPPDTQLGKAPPLPVIFGGFRFDGAKTYQSAYSFGENGWAATDKTRLVVFGEYVPFRQFLPFADAFRLSGNDLSPGTGVRTTTLAGIHVGPLLCFEALFPDVSSTLTQKGANLLAVMAIDDYYGEWGAKEQLVGSSVWRSIESGVPIVRSSTNGTSLATDARGRVVSVAPTNRLFALRCELAIPRTSDAYPQRFLFVWLCWGSLAVSLVGAVFWKTQQDHQTLSL